MAQLANMGAVTNPQVLEMKHKLQGQMAGLNAVVDALRGNDIFLKILAGE